MILSNLANFLGMAVSDFSATHDANVQHESFFNMEIWFPGGNGR